MHDILVKKEQMELKKPLKVWNMQLRKMEQLSVFSCVLLYTTLNVEELMLWSRENSLRI